MKRAKILLLAIPALLLGGCEKEISKEDAKARAKEIEEHEVVASDFAKLTMEMNSSRKGKDDGKDVDDSSSMKVAVEVSAKDYFIHMRSESDGTISENWIYVSESKLYTVNYSKGEEESKTYTVLETGAEEAFKTLLGTQNKQISEQLSGKSYLTNLFNEDGDMSAELENAKVEAKYYSSGEGNLRVEMTVTSTEGEEKVDYSVTGTIKASVKFDNYMLSTLESSSELTNKSADGTTNFVSKSSTKIEASIAEFKVTLPNLEGYTKAAAVDLGL